jgi:hypothetical protein
MVEGFKKRKRQNMIPMGMGQKKRKIMSVPKDALAFPKEAGTAINIDGKQVGSPNFVGRGIAAKAEKVPIKNRT